MMGWRDALACIFAAIGLIPSIGGGTGSPEFAVHDPEVAPLTCYLPRNQRPWPSPNRRISGQAVFLVRLLREGRLGRLVSLSSGLVTARQDDPDRRTFTGFGLQFQARFQQLAETFDDR
jgi:hypothetical protein